MTHPRMPDPRKWYACEYPERPPEVRWTEFRIGCEACLVALIAASRAAPSNRRLMYTRMSITADSGEELATLDWEEARALWRVDS